ncbi:MAG TPA: hypothetical protein VHW46_08275 [Terracidiphilus sp.]|jgi:hypothetical protein|nr:hypothetical protein [Terracidiphilus sp.]
MPTHEGDPLGSHGPKPEEIDSSAGYEQSDVRVTGIIVFLTSLAIFVAVCGIITYGMGKLINAWMNKEDGPTSKWVTTVDVRQLGNLPTDPELQHKMAELTQRFPTPRIQTDDGNQDVADLHQREDLLLDNYSWVDQSQGKVRIPVDRAMELLAQRGLPVAPATTQQATLMTGDSKPTVAIPLTSGFAPTAYEQDEAVARAAEARQKQ